MLSSTTGPQWRRITRQTTTLLHKNLLVFSKAPLATIARAFILPVLITTILCLLKNLNSASSSSVSNGIAASPTQVLALGEAITKSGRPKLVFVRNGISNDSISGIADGVSNLPGMEYVQVLSTADPVDLYSLCPQSIHGFSDCFAAVIFEAHNETNVEYTIAVDSGLAGDYSNGNFEDDESLATTRLLPLQWAMDSYIGNFTTAQRPSLNPYSGTVGQKADSAAAQRTVPDSLWLGLIPTFVGPIFVLILIGITYHLSTFVATERQSAMAELMAAQSVTTIPRILSTFISFLVLYLPGLITCSILMTQLLFTKTSDGLLLLLTVLAGASTTVSSHFIASFFSKAQLAGLYTSVLTFSLALVTLPITLTNDESKSSQALGISLIFPPAAWVFCIGDVATAEHSKNAFSLVSAIFETAIEGEGTASISTEQIQMLNGYMYAIFFVVQIVVYGALTYLIEQWLWSVPRSFDRIDAQSDVALRCTNLTKTYAAKRRWYWPFKARAALVAAVNHLNLELKKGSVTFLLGPNGGGKTTTLKCVAGMTSMDAGSRLELNEDGVVFGICPQNNVFWENLTVEEHIRIWRKLKTAAFQNANIDEDDVLAECDLVSKAKAPVKTLSGGQMRKLQLAISFVGGSKVCCIDEASSGLDPLSRRNIWSIIQRGHSRRTALITTHFLDEADLLSDHIAIIYKGSLVCEGPGTSLKARFGDEYVIRSYSDAGADNMVWRAPNSAEATRKILELEALSEDTPFNVVFPTLEQVFLKVTSDTAILEQGGDGVVGTEEETTTVVDEKIFALEQDETRELDLEMGRSIGLFRQVFALLVKRYTLLLQKAAWIAYLINLAIPIIIAGALYNYVHKFAEPLQTCQMNEIKMRESSFDTWIASDSVPFVPGLFPSLPSGARSSLSPVNFFADSEEYYTTIVGPTSQWAGEAQDSLYLASLSSLKVVLDSLSSNTTQDKLLLNTRVLVNSKDDIVSRISTVAGGGFSGFGIFSPTSDSAILYHDTSGTMMFVNMQAFSLITNRIGNAATNGTARAVKASVRPMVHVRSIVDYRSMPMAVLLTLTFIAAASIAVIYPSFEMVNRVRALHYCNGVSPLALWLAYVLFDTQFIIIESIIAWILLFAGSVSNIWYEPNYLIGVFILFGIATYLGTYVLSLFVKKAAFAIAAGIHIVLFVLYLSAYIMVESFGSLANRHSAFSMLQYGLGLSSPGANLGRALFIATNSFDVLCGKYGISDVTNGFAYARYGAVYANLTMQILFLIIFLCIYEYGSADWIRRNITNRGVPARLHYIVDTTDVPTNVASNPSEPAPILAVSRVTKFFGRLFATENVTFNISSNETLALLGANGAGKTTMINMIRGELTPDYGTIHVDGISVQRSARKARLRMGVCPQDDAVDNLTVQQTLWFYAMVKGLKDVAGNVDRVLEALNIETYRGMQLKELSGGTKRKLTVAIALLGNPPILLLDEPSTGQDAGAKRILWHALRSLGGNRAILLTTHSMEEAEALASRVAIMGTRMLATGTLSELQTRYGGSYSVRAVRAVDSGGEEVLVEGKQNVEEKIREAFDEADLAVQEYEDRYGQVGFKVACDRRMMGRIMLVLEGLKSGFDANEGRADGGGAGGGGSSAAAAVVETRRREAVLLDYTVTGPTLEEVFMNVARDAGNARDV